MDTSGFFPKLGAYLKANRLFFLLATLIILLTFGYFWWQAGFTFEIGKFFAAGPAGGPQIVINNAPVSHGQGVSISWSKTDADECHALNWIDTGGLNEGTAVSAPVDACAASSGTVTIVCTYASTGGAPGQTSKTFAINSSSCPTATTSPTPTSTGGADVCAGALESHTDSVTGVKVCILSRTFNANRCTVGQSGTVQQVVGVVNTNSIAGNPAGYIKSSGFSDPSDGCGATQTGPFAYGPTGPSGIPFNGSGVYTFSYNINAMTCGRVQLDACFFLDGYGCSDKDQWNILGKVVSSGKGNCPTPTPSVTVTPTPTTTATPTSTPTGTPTPTVTQTPAPTPTPPAFACAPLQQQVSVGQSANFTATGGTGSYTWYAPGGSPLPASRATFSVSYSSPGFKTVTLASGGQQVACTVTINALATPTPTPSVLPLVCTPASQTVQIGQTASFQVSGGSGDTNGSRTQYTWGAVGGTPVSGTGLTFGTSYQTSGTKTVTVSDASGMAATCLVTVQAVSTTVSPSPTTPGLTIQKLVRNVTQNGGEADSVNANPADTVEFSIKVSSAGAGSSNQAGAALNVVVRDTLPAGLSYVAGSTTIDGTSAADGIISTGLNLGDMPSGRTVIIRFRATVASAAFFSSGTTSLVNTAYARGSNVPEVSDVAFVTVMNAPQSLTMSLVKMGRNTSRGETGEHTPVYSSPAQTIEFILRVRNTSNSALNNVMLRDVVPTGITPIAGSVRIGGATASDTLTGAGLSLGTLAVGQEVVVTFSGRVANSSELPAGTTTLINTVQVSATGVPTLNAQLPVIITNSTVVVPPVSTGPGESTVLALIISGIITLLYVGYTSTDTYRRHEVGELVKETKDDTFNFRR